MFPQNTGGGWKKEAQVMECAVERMIRLIAHCHNLKGYENPAWMSQEVRIKG